MLRELHTELGIPEDYGRGGLRPAFEEAAELVEVGPNIVGRVQRLMPAAAAAWRAMQAAAAADGVTLLENAVASGAPYAPYAAGEILSLSCIHQNEAQRHHVQDEVIALLAERPDFAQMTAH